MISTWLYVVELVLLMVFVMLIYNLVKNFFIEKLRAIKWAKWVSLAVSILLIVGNSLVGGKFGAPSIQYNAGMIVLIFSLMITFDLLGWLRSSKRERSKKNDIVIRPKAKPNRAKKKDN